jgi:hypothetical protein
LQAAVVIVDVDDIAGDTSPSSAHHAAAQPAPLVVVSRRTNIARIALRLGATVGLHKPVNCSLLMQALMSAARRSLLENHHDSGSDGRLASIRWPRTRAHVSGRSRTPQLPRFPSAEHDRDDRSAE